MKFVCEQCGSRYTISDERVRNKALRIRCKKCSNIIEVRDPAIRESLDAVREPTGSVKEDKGASIAPPSPKSQEKKDKSKGPGGSVLADKFAATFRAGKKPESKGTPGLYKAVKQSAKVMEKQDVDLAHWFVAIDKTPTGPVSARKVLEHKRAGRVSDDTLIWKEGMPDWVRLRNSKELVGLIARLELVEGEKASVPPPPPEPTVKRKGLFNERDTKTQDPLKGSALGVLTEHAEEAPSDRTMGSEGLDIEEISVSVGVAEPNPEDSFFAGQASNTRSGIAVALADGQMADIQSLSPPRPVGANRVMVIASVGFFIAAMGLLGVVLFGGQTAETQTVSNNVTKVIEKVVYRDRYITAEAGRNEQEEDGVEQEEKNAGQPKNVKGVRAKTKAGDDDKKAPAEPADDRTQALMERFGMAGDKGAVGRTNKSARGGVKPGATLSANELRSVVAKNQNILKTCYERALKTGGVPSDKDVRVNFRLTVGASGSVKSVSLGGEGASYQGLSSCLQRAVKKWVFPPSGADSPVEFPFVFTPVR